jgi:hypothetical protein
MNMRRGFLIFVIFLLASSSPRADELGPVAGPAKRRVYVLHSGLHTIFAHREKNIAAISIREGLLKRGVADDDIVVLDNPYPTARWYRMFPLDSMGIFADSAEPGSELSQVVYLKMHRALQARGVRPDDDIVWIGHSAGGQMGLTMGSLAMNLARFPGLAKLSAPYHFDMIILLGAPICFNALPREVKLRHYYSPQDKVVSMSARYGPTLLRTFGHRLPINVIPPGMDQNDMVRVFLGVSHPYWDVDERVLDRILAETDAQYRPFWQAGLLTYSPGMSLMRLVSRALKEHYHITFEDPPWPR